jgi:hypothetical protein
MLPVAPIATLAHNKTFAEYYNNASMDEFQGDYTTVMTVFNAPGNVAATPASIRELVTNDPKNSSMGYIVLVVTPAAPNSPGLIYGLHSLAKYTVCLGQPAIPWDDKIFASLHDVVARNDLLPG